MHYLTLLKNYKYYLILFQLALINYFIHFFNIGEAFKLNELFIIFSTGFLIHSLVKIEFKKPLYILTFIIGLFWIMTWRQSVKFWIVFSLILIVINLPIKLVYRKLILIIIAISLAIIKYLDLRGILSSNIISLIACVYMFRSIIYLYEVKHLKKRVGLLDQVSYFIAPSNLIYPIFPVIDFKTFTNNFYSADPIYISQKGILTITRGLLHIYAYRIIEAIQYTDIFTEKSSFGLLINILFSFAFIIRLSGILHFSVGVIQLFGYNLPDIFNNYFLSKGFADFWRRINIYWKDFILKIVFNPLYFKLRKKKIKYIVSITTIISFIITVLFHSYQFFWLTGKFILKDTDFLFWIGLGIIIIIETNLSGKKQSKFKVINYIIDGLKISFTLITIAVLWYIWNFDSLEKVFNTIKSYNLSLKLWHSLLILAAITIVLTISNLLFDILKRKKNLFLKANIINTTLIMLIPIFFLAYQAYLPNHNIKRKLVTEHFLNGIDGDKALIGYYENTMDNNFISLSFKKPKQILNIDTLNCISVIDQTIHIKKRAKNGINYSSLNKYGYREEITEKKPFKNIHRMNFYGGSNEFGARITSDSKVFIEQLKQRLKFNEIEILNLSIPSKGFLFNVHEFLMKDKYENFTPKVPVFFYHYGQEKLVSNGLFRRFKNCDCSEYLKQLRLFNKCKKGEQCLMLNEIESYKYMISKLAEKSKKLNILPVLILMPPNNNILQNNLILMMNKVKKIALENGVYVIDITNSLNNEPYRISKTDKHYNEEGHSLITKSLAPKLKEFIENKVSR